MPQTDPKLDAALALTRFGMGAGPGEIDAVAADPHGWLTAQIRPAGGPVWRGDFPDSEARMADFTAYRVEQDASDAGRPGRRPAAPAPARPAAMQDAERRNGAMPYGGSMQDGTPRDPLTPLEQSRRDFVQGTAAEFLARAQLGASTPDGFAERWSLFWANAITVSAVKFSSAVFMGQYEREAIRPRVFGKFEDLLIAAESHPAMLLYLDQAQSIGPGSVLGSRRNAGLNENLAREALELHTVGADGGYTQADVTELARALTGWSVPAPRDAEFARSARGGRGPGAQARAAALAVLDGPRGFVFRPGIHEPGVRTIMGRRYAQDDAAQGETILRDLARHPRTGARLARRIAAHFVADDPPEALVRRLEAAWSGSQGDLGVVARTLIAAPEAWTPTPAKFKTPYDFVVSAHRALGVPPPRIQPLQQALAAMGQPAFAPPSPEGWPDTAEDWAGPDALVKRLNWAKAVGDRAMSLDPVQVAETALGPRLGERSYNAVARAGSRPEAMTLLLMSPEFQRR